MLMTLFYFLSSVATATEGASGEYDPLYEADQLLDSLEKEFSDENTCIWSKLTDIVNYVDCTHKKTSVNILYSDLIEHEGMYKALLGEFSYSNLFCFLDDIRLMQDILYRAIDKVGSENFTDSDIFGLLNMINWVADFSKHIEKKYSLYFDKGNKLCVQVESDFPEGLNVDEKQAVRFARSQIFKCIFPKAKVSKDSFIDIAGKEYRSATTINLEELENQMTSIAFGQTAIKSEPAILSLLESCKRLGMVDSDLPTNLFMLFIPKEKDRLDRLNTNVYQFLMCSLIKSTSLEKQKITHVEITGLASIIGRFASLLVNENQNLLKVVEQYDTDKYFSRVSPLTEEPGSIFLGLQKTKSSKSTQKTISDELKTEETDKSHPTSKILELMINTEDSKKDKPYVGKEGVREFSRFFPLVLSTGGMFDLADALAYFDEGRCSAIFKKLMDTKFTEYLEYTMDTVFQIVPLRRDVHFPTERMATGSYHWLSEDKLSEDDIVGKKEMIRQIMKNSRNDRIRSMPLSLQRKAFEKQSRCYALFSREDFSTKYFRSIEDRANKDELIIQGLVDQWLSASPDKALIKNNLNEILQILQSSYYLPRILSLGIEFITQIKEVCYKAREIKYTNVGFSLMYDLQPFSNEIYTCLTSMPENFEESLNTQELFTFISDELALLETDVSDRKNLSIMLNGVSPLLETIEKMNEESALYDEIFLKDNIEAVKEFYDRFEPVIFSKEFDDTDLVFTLWNLNVDYQEKSFFLQYPSCKLKKEWIGAAFNIQNVCIANVIPGKFKEFFDNQGFSEDDSSKKQMLKQKLYGNGPKDLDAVYKLKKGNVDDSGCYFISPDISEKERLNLDIEIAKKAVAWTVCYIINRSNQDIFEDFEMEKDAFRRMFGPLKMQYAAIVMMALYTEKFFKINGEKVNGENLMLMAEEACTSGRMTKQLGRNDKTERD